LDSRWGKEKGGKAPKAFAWEVWVGEAPKAFGLSIGAEMEIIFLLIVTASFLPPRHEGVTGNELFEVVLNLLLLEL